MVGAVGALQDVVAALPRKRVVAVVAGEPVREAVAEQLSEYDFSQFKPVRFEFENKSARVNMRLPGSLLAAVKKRAEKRGIPYQRLIREALERELATKR